MLVQTPNPDGTIKETKIVHDDGSASIYEGGQPGRMPLPDERPIRVDPPLTTEQAMWYVEQIMARNAAAAAEAADKATQKKRRNPNMPKRGPHEQGNVEPYEKKPKKDDQGEGGGVNGGQSNGTGTLTAVDSDSKTR